MDIDERELVWVKQVLYDKLGDELLAEINRILDKSIEAARFLAEGVEAEWCRRNRATIYFRADSVEVELPNGTRREGGDLLIAASNARGDY